MASKYKFEDIPEGESRFYPVNRLEGETLRKSANYWTMRAAKNGERLSCSHLTRTDINGNKILLGMEVKKL